MPCRSEEEPKNQQINRLLRANMGLDNRLAEYRRRWEMVGRYLTTDQIREIEDAVRIEKPKGKDENNRN